MAPESRSSTCALPGARAQCGARWRRAAGASRSAPDIAREAQRALDRILRSAARPTTDATGAFRNLPDEFHELLARLDKEPVEIASPYATDAGGGATGDAG
jgi:hypothetical protein